MTASTSSSPHPTGADFLLGDTAPAAVFIPEDLAAEERQMTATAERFVNKEVMPNLEALERQEPGLARRLFAKAAELGLLCIEVSEEFGGLGLGKVAAIGVNQQLSRLPGFGITCGAHTGIGTQPLGYFGTVDQKRRYLPRLASGEWMAAYCLSEAGSGSDALGMRTRAALSPDGRHYVLNGEKMWITNAAWADLFTVFAKVDGQEVTAFLVERTWPGVSTGREEHKLGIKSSSTRRVILDNVRVPVENVLGEVGKGAYIAFNILNFGRYSLGAGVLGAAKDQLRAAAVYAAERRQFGRALADFGLVRRKLVDMAVDIYAADSAVYRTAGAIDAVFATGEMLPLMTPPFARALDEFALECSVLKVRCSEALARIADESIQIHGGYGFTEEFPAARAWRDSRINRIFEGTNEINRIFIPGLLLRREQRGRFPLTATVTAARAEPVVATEVVAIGDELDRAKAWLGRVRQLIFRLWSLAARKHGADFTAEQEVTAALSDVIGELYLGESAVLRAQKLRKSGGRAALPAMLAVLYVNDATIRIEGAARRVLDAVVAPGDYPTELQRVRALLAWTPPDTIRAVQAVAGEIRERGGYPVG